jgi:hypothetical protein
MNCGERGRPPRFSRKGTQRAQKNELKNSSFLRFLVPKLHLGTPPVPREIPFRANSISRYRTGIGNEIASASAFPSATWERGEASGLPDGTGLEIK